MNNMNECERLDFRRWRLRSKQIQAIDQLKYYLGGDFSVDVKLFHVMIKREVDTTSIITVAVTIL